MADPVSFTFTFWEIFWLILSSAFLMIARAWIKAHYDIQIKGWKDFFEFIIGEGSEGLVKVVPIVKEALSSQATMVPVPVPASDPELKQLVANTILIMENMDTMMATIEQMDLRILKLERDTKAMESLTRANQFIASRNLTEKYANFVPPEPAPDDSP